MECANPGWNLYLALYDEPYHNEMDARKTKVSGRAVLAHIRNIVIERYLKPGVHEYVHRGGMAAVPSSIRTPSICPYIWIYSRRII